MRSVRRSLESAGPLEFLMLASSMLEITDPGPIGTAGGAESTLDELLESIIGTPRRETTALLHAWATMLPDGEDSERVRAAMTDRKDPMPRWLRKLEDVEIGHAYRANDIYGDQEHLSFGMSLGRTVLAFAALIDHNAGSAVADGFPAPVDVDQMIGSAVGDPEVEVIPADPATVGADLAYAIDVGRHTYPPYETQTWPGCRPMLEWLIRRFPVGESGYASVEEFPGHARDQIVDEFLASPFGAGLDLPDHREAADLIVDFACGYGRVSPYGWSTTRLDIFVNDWYPRKVLADREFHTAVNEVLPRYVEFAHRRLGVPDYETRRVVDLAEIAIPSASTPGFAAAQHTGHALDWLARRVGGQAALLELNDAPVPDEAMAWDGIDEDIRPAVTEVLGMLDALAEELDDREYRTLFRRALARTARGDSAVFSRRGSRAGLAAAIAWVVGRGNDLFDWISVGDMNEWFGLKREYSTGQRGQTVRQAMGIDRWEFDHADLVGVDLLHSAVRRHIIDLTQDYRPRLDDADWS